MTGGGLCGSAALSAVAGIGLFAACGPQDIDANAARHTDVKEVNRQDAKRTFVEEPSPDVDLLARRVIGATNFLFSREAFGRSSPHQKNSASSASWRLTTTADISAVRIL
jgi:hypothetical protein